ncbi:carbohydrate binding domain-containing protein [Paenibacillus sp. GYB004]|uniref:carbohydrate binding domain-containing protein n=1 Tax=Paenibacillus sp. GYB004 TaxID=2994393 RepID=UPI002F964A2C
MVLRRKGWACLVIVCMLVQLLPAVWGPAANAETAEWGPNLLQNPGFEQAVSGVPDHWEAMGGWSNPELLLSPASARSGGNGIQVQTANATNPWVAQKVYLDAGSTYEFSSWFKSAAVQGKGVVMKAEFYSTDTRSSEGWISGPFGPYIRAVTGDWQHYSFRLKAPEGTKVAYVYVRLWGTGSVSFDDAAVRLVNLTMTTDQLFYYTDAEQGHVRMETRFPDDDYTGKTVDVTITDSADGTVAASVYGLPAQPEMSYSFDPRGLDLQKRYQVKAVLRAADQSVIAEEASLISRWARPQALPPGGTVQVDGEPYFPVIAYHPNVDDYPDLAEIGVNTIQLPNVKTKAEIHYAMDQAAIHGLKVMFPLYYFMSISRDEEAIRQYTAEFKDHPALLAWMIIDEPSGNGVPVEKVAAAYEIVRSVDPVHPVYMVEGSRDEYASYGRAPDIFTVDVYPLPSRPIASVGDGVREAIEAAPGGRPVWSILQTFAYPNTAWSYLPTITEVRNMAYQSVLAGAGGIGYYAVNDSNWRLIGSPLWPGLKAFNNELPLLRELAMTEPVSRYRGDGTEWAVWETAEGETYAVALNETTAERNVSVTLPFTGYQAELLYGGAPSSYSDGTAQLDVTLGAYETKVYRLTSFHSLAQAAEELRAAGVGLSDHPYWKVMFLLIGGKLNSMIAELSGSSPSVDDAVRSGREALLQLRLLESWVSVHKESLLRGGKAEMLAHLSGLADRIGEITASPVRIGLQISPQPAVGGDHASWSVTVHNTSDRVMRDAAVTVRYPEALQLAPAVLHIGTLAAGSAVTEQRSFPVPSGLSDAGHALTAEISFRDRLVSLTNEAAQSFAVIAPLEAELVPASIAMNRQAAVPFEIKLTNRSQQQSYTIELDASASPAFSVSLPDTATVAAGGSATVTGSVYLQDGSAPDGTYAVMVAAQTAGVDLDPLRLDIALQRNLVLNPGFEAGTASGLAPASWNLGAGAWDTGGALEGQRSVRLIPDSVNANNSIISTKIETAEGKSYTLSGWTRNASTTGQVSLGVRFVNRSNSTISYLWTSAPAGTDWVKVENTFTPPAGTKSMHIYFMMNRAANGEASLDSVVLTEQP